MIVAMANAEIAVSPGSIEPFVDASELTQAGAYCTMIITS
jgi:hypothetical protein